MAKVRIHPELHRRLAPEAAESIITLKRLATDKLRRARSLLGQLKTYPDSR